MPLAALHCDEAQHPTPGVVVGVDDARLLGADGDWAVLMSDQLALPTEPARARCSDPVTSHAAAASVHHQTETRTWILQALTVCPMTDTDLIAWARRVGRTESESGIRTRRKELVSAGHVAPTGRTETMPSGRLAIVWGVTQ